MKKEQVQIIAEIKTLVEKLSSQRLEIKTLVEKLEVSLKENETKSKEGIPLPKKIVKG
jgi:hypothetical protein